jgi:uncharacterized membrane protein
MRQLGFHRNAQGLRAEPVWLWSCRMNLRTRKLVGTIALLVFLLVYALVVMGIGAGRIATAAPLAQLGFFIVAGLAWVVPAGVLIRWMQRPDA